METVKKRNISTLVVVVLLMIIIVLLVLLLQKKENQISQPSNRDPNMSVGQIEGKTKEEIQEELNKIVEEGMFNISINSNIVFENGNSKGDVRIENIEANRLLMSVQILLDSSQKVIYETGMIEPGYHIQEDTLDVPLSKGVYPATAMFTAYDPATEAAIGQAGAKITITIKN